MGTGAPAADGEVGRAMDIPLIAMTFGSAGPGGQLRTGVPPARPGLARAGQARPVLARPGQARPVLARPGPGR